MRKTARVAAEAARDAAAMARELHQVKAERDRALAQAQASARAATAAGKNADDAANAADEAGRQSGVSSAQARRARNAAASARAAAATADRAADRAESLARSAAQASEEAFRFAEQAATHAENAEKSALAAAAAAAAEKAQYSAAESAKAAAVAVESANLAVTAATKAVALEKLARQEDEARLAEATAQGVLAAQEAAAQEQAAKAEGGELAAWNRGLLWDTAEEDRVDAATRTLLTEAAASGTPASELLDKGRRAAVALLTTGGEWTRAAAEEALAGGEVEMRSWLATGRKVAVGQDDRARVWHLIDTLADGAEKTAAKAALEGDDAAVEAFLRTRNYPGKTVRDRQALYQIVEGAKAAGHPTVKTEAENALAGRIDAHTFLRSGQHIARTADERRQVYRVMDAGGPEVKAAGQVALVGPPSYISYFLTAARYQAAQRDVEQAAHVATVHKLILEAQQYAQKALEDAARAQQSAAEAKKSADQAAQSAQTARNASNSAQASASAAARSAATATAASRRAQADAEAAYQAKVEARRAAQAAGKDAAAADRAAKEAADIYTTRLREWEAQQRSTAPGSGQDGNGSAADDHKTWGCLADPKAVSKECLKVYTTFADALINPAKCSAPANSGTPGCQMLGDLKTFVEENPELLLDMLQFVLMTCGLVPGAGEVCDGIDAAVSFARKDWVGGFLSLGAMVPVVGWLATGAKGARFADKFRNLKNIIDGFAKRCKMKGSSFVAGTRVLLPGGRSEEIEEIEADDSVVATDPVAGLTGLKAVTATPGSTGLKEIVDIEIDVDGAAGTETATISATRNHPFWVPQLDSWAPAASLLAGLPLLSSTGAPVQIVAVSERTETTQVYNLTVAGHETYYVLAGDVPVLVHNCGDLAKDEDVIVRGGEGHTLKSHVNVTDDDIKRRAIKEKTDISRWKDQVTAQEVIDFELSKRKAEIDRWKAQAGRGANDQKVFKGQWGPTGGPSLGRTAKRDGTVDDSGNTYEIVIRYAPNHPKKFIVYTSYPTRRR